MYPLVKSVAFNISVFLRKGGEFVTAKIETSAPLLSCWLLV